MPAILRPTAGWISIAALLGSALVLDSTSARLHAAAPAVPVGHFEPAATYTVSGSVAEIVAVTPNGRVLAYTDSEEKQVGFVDIDNPFAPVEIGTVGVDGEPTSVAFTVNGRWALAVVHGDAENSEIDHVAVFDTLNIDAAPVVIPLAGQPDCIAMSRDGRYAAIAIENELSPDIPGFVTILDLAGTPSLWTVRNVGLTGLAADPEPEFVDINNVNQLAVTLQENNLVALIDLASGSILNAFSAGNVNHLADTNRDGTILFDDLLQAAREPDAIGWTPFGRLVTANEGEFGQGGRCFTMFSTAGDIVFDSGADLELALAAGGFYDDNRSNAKGTEPEGIEIGVFANHTFLFVGMERSRPGAVAVYELQGADETPRLIQILATGSRPEGLLAIPQRNLFVSANEGNGTISVFVGKPGSP